MSILATPGGRFLAGLLIVILLVGGSFAYGNHRGYASAEAKYTAQIAVEHAKNAQAALEELHRQQDANAAAKAREASQIAEIQKQDDELDNLREEQRLAAHQDPNAAKPVLGAASVQRINKIR